MANGEAYYNWKILDPLTGRMRKTRYKAREEDMLKAHPEAIRLDYTREERAPIDPMGYSHRLFMGDDLPP